MSKLKIAFVSSEVAPYSKTGGLADVSGTLPDVVAGLGHDVLVFSPRYQSVDKDRFLLTEVRSLKLPQIVVGSESYSFSILAGPEKPGRARAYFIDCPELFFRGSLYKDPVTDDDYEDNDIRYIVFVKAVLASLQALGPPPEIIHANDWQSALLPAYLKTSEAGNPYLAECKTVLTIHNMGYHGSFPMRRSVNLGLDASYFFSMAPFEFWNHVNFLKAGIYYADIVTTVSETYAREIQNDPEYGCGLEGVLSNRGDTVFGVVNGANYDVWSPEHDKAIWKTYSRDSLPDKYVNKQGLLSHSGLARDRLQKPLIGVISRLDAQKGFDLIEEIAGDLFELDFTFVLLGTGAAVYHDLIKSIEKSYPKRVRAYLTFDDELAHKIEAGSDMFLMPSRYEPCGLNQMYSLKYGTVPVARKTGGLADTIVDFDADRKNGTGFLFEDYTGEALLAAVKRALDLYYNKRSWNALVKRGMKQDFSWERSARAYIKLYKKAMAL
jgi:starch synthase